MRPVTFETRQRDVKQQKFLIGAILVCFSLFILVLPLILIPPLFLTLWFLQFVFAILDYWLYKYRNRRNYVLLTLGYFVVIILVENYFQFIRGFLLYRLIMVVTPLALTLWFYLLSLEDLYTLKKEEKYIISKGFNEDLLDDIMIHQ